MTQPGKEEKGKHRHREGSVTYSRCTLSCVCQSPPPETCHAIIKAVTNQDRVLFHRLRNSQTKQPRYFLWLKHTLPSKALLHMHYLASFASLNAQDLLVTCFLLCLASQEDSRVWEAGMEWRCRRGICKSLCQQTDFMAHLPPCPRQATPPSHLSRISR